MPCYEVWKFHIGSGTRVITEDEHNCDTGGWGVDSMDEILEVVQA
jgi:hypothetical protein